MALTRMSVRSRGTFQQPSPASPSSPSSGVTAMDTDGALEDLFLARSRSTSMDGASASGARRSRSAVGRRAAPFRQQTLQLGDLLSSRDAHSEAGTEYYDPAGALWC